jgi:dTDP-4-amino-4,6-dideoxygalactose transaminase
MFNYTKHSISKKDIIEVTRVLKKYPLTQGGIVEEFEKKLSKKFKCKYVLAVNNATSALTLAGRVLNWKKTDTIIAPSLTYVASILPALYSQSNVEFADIDRNYYTITSEILEKKILELQKKKIKIKAAIITDYAGQPADWKKINSLAKKFKFQLINDNCHALGSKYNENIGYASKYADIVVQSFHAAKNITTGEGGCIFTNSKKIFEKIKSLRSHCVKKNIPDYWNYDVDDIGYNFRLTDFQSALGISQLNKLNEFIKKKNILANEYKYYLRDNTLIKIPKIKNNVYHAYHLYPIVINFDELKISKNKFFFLMEKKGIKLQVHYPPIHKFKIFRHKKIVLKNTEFFFKNAISLPMYFQLKKRNVKFICKQLLDIIKKFKIQNSKISD